MTCCERTEVLDEAIENSELLRRFSPVEAVTFGVIPIEERGDAMVVACGHTWNPRCRPFVEQVLGQRIVTMVFRDGVIRQYLLDAYLEEGTVNHNTFASPDFIDDLGNAHLLTTDKIEQIGEVRNALPADQLVLLDVTYVSQLNNLDGGGKSNGVSCGPMHVPFRIRDDGHVVVQEEVDDDVAVVMRKDFFYDAEEGSGEESFHGIQSVYLSALPHMIHPSEIQLTQVAEDGSVTFYVYDHCETLHPGETKEWTVRYYFMSLGNRHSRVLTLRVNAIHVVDRCEITVADRILEWTTADLTRWLRLGQPGKL